MTARAVVGLLGSIAASIAMLAIATRGFTAFTTDTARSLDVAAHPTPVPPIRLVDMARESVVFPTGSRSTIVDFVYTRCVTVCLSLGGAFEELQAEIGRRGLAGRVGLLSISFDPAWDTPERLEAYARLLRADRTIWTLATPAQPDELQATLRAYGVRVLPDGQGGFAHNAALHVVDPGGRLVAILPLEATGAALETALAATERALVHAALPRP